MKVARNRNNENFPKKLLPKTKKHKCAEHTKLPIRLLFIQGHVKSRFNDGFPFKNYKFFKI